MRVMTLSDSAFFRTQLTADLSADERRVVDELHRLVEGANVARAGLQSFESILPRVAMRHVRVIAAGLVFVAAFGSSWFAQRDGAPPPADSVDPVRVLVGRLDLERYKTTIKGLTQFGDRRQGTDRNRAAVDWIEAQLKSYGCTNTERIKYEYNGRQLKNDSTNTVDSARAAANPNAARGGGVRGAGAPAGGGGGRGRGRGGNPPKGFTARTGVNTNPELQPDTALRR